MDTIILEYAKQRTMLIQAIIDNEESYKDDTKRKQLFSTLLMRQIVTIDRILYDYVSFNSAK